jgi:DNA-binding SARP family transcriptional activator/tetratricopeptide (TPR) repeat protein
MGAEPAEFRLLGPIQVRVGGRGVTVATARQRAVLAVLLLEANRAVPVDRIVERVWGERRLPDRPQNAVRTYVSLLRTALSGVDGVMIGRQSGGYLIDVDEQRVDVHQFHDLLRQARRAEDDARAVGLIEAALGLWRGEPFADLDTPWINAARDALVLDRQAARLDLTDVRLRRGQHATALAELATQAAQYPLDERIAGQLMLALYRSGRQADALTHYRRIHRQLAGELGTDPGAALQQLQRQILAADEALAAPTIAPDTDRAPVSAAAPTPTAVPEQRPATVPRQLPAAPRRFTGRDRELAQLTAALDEWSEPERTLVISAIGGTGGIGKTWLALHWAHQHLDRFPDGQLYVNLRGFDPTGQPLAPATALRGFLDTLGVPPASIPADLDAQVGLYRSLVADKRMLIVADNARDINQVAPLLPGSPTCTVLVTSRHHLGGLVAAHGARSVDLDVFAELEARQVLVRHLGRGRAAVEPQAVADLVDCCAGLPLALGIVAARAGRHPDFPLAELAAELRDRSRRLDALDPGDPQATLRAVLSWSADALSPEAKSGFSLLSLAPGPDLGLPAAESLLGRTAAATRAVLRELEHASLIQQHTPGRYRMHDLIRLYAADCADRDHTPAEREAAARRVLDFYLHSAFLADRLLTPHRQSILLDPPASGTHPFELADDPAAAAWFEVEHANLLAAQQASGDRQWYLTVWQLAWALTSFHMRRGLSLGDLAVWEAALDAAAHLPDPAARIRAHRLLGSTYTDLGRDQEAIEQLHQAVVLAEQHQEHAELAHTHLRLARAREMQGNFRKALNHATRALDLYRALDQPAREAQALNAVGWCAARLGDYDTARAHCQAALALHRRHETREAETATLDSLGYIDHHTGHHRGAIQHYQQALDLLRGYGNTYQSAAVLDHLGHSYAALGEYQEARAVWQQALELYLAQWRATEAEHVRQYLATLSLDLIASSDARSA